VLSSVVISALNTARNKGIDSSAKSQFAEARSQAQLFYDANKNAFEFIPGGQTDVCVGDGTATGGVKGTASFILSAAFSEGLGGGNIVLDGAGAAGKAVCNSTANGWAMEIQLKDGNYYCVDANGNATSTSNPLILSNGLDVTC
jgi:hypothetical protein